ncbi:MAG: plasmid stabilization protein [Sphingobium sp.]|nr:plasmid stabilization protein [Sphingobium sp.]
MASVTVRNLPDEVHRAIRARAVAHGRSTEAEIRDILAHAVKPEKRIRIGDALATIGRQAGLTDLDMKALDRSYSPAGPMSIDE